MSNQKKVKKPLHEYPDKKLDTQLYSHVGMDSMRHNGIHAVDDRTVITSSGNAVMFVDLKTGGIESMIGPAEGGIGAVCVHPSRTMFVVCEKSANPLAIVYEYPSKKRLKTMKQGAVKGYSACCFNEEGNLLATVAQEPDFMITVWNWQEEKTVLRNKAFGSDIFSVAFNPFNDGLLVTSGLGHIKFWSMAETFTGLKLQGHIGKFGRVEISDITGFVSLPDGKVVSGSEFGSLLLWEGNLIKCELVRALEEGETPEDEEAPYKQCHKDNIPVVKMIENGRIIMSAARDGYVRYWSTEEIDAAENNGVDLYCTIKCLKELYIGEGVQVQSLTMSAAQDQWIVLDAAGAIRTIPYWGYDALMSNLPGATVYKAPEPVLTFNSGRVFCAAASPGEYSVVTGGEDGTLRLMDYIAKKDIYSTRFNTAVVQVRYLDQTIDKSGRLMLTGFADGSMRLVRKAKNCFEVLGGWRPHSSAISSIAIDVKGTQIFTVSEDGTAFYFKMSDGGNLITPVGFCKLPAVAADAEWTTEGDACFVSFASGNIIALQPPAAGAVKPDESFEFQGKWSGLGYRQKQLPPPKEKKPGQDQESSSDEDEDDENKDVGPWSVAFIKRLPTNVYAIGMRHPELAYTYRAHMRYEDALGPPPIPPTGVDEGRVEEPALNIAYRDYVPLGCSTSASGKTLVVVCEHSRVLLRSISDGKIGSVTHSAQLHDGVDGRICQAVVSHDDKLLITVGVDGMVFVQTFAGAQGPPKADAPKLDGLPQAIVKQPEPIENSIQKQKELDDQAKAEELALGKKTLLMRKITEVHKDYEALLNQNDEAKGGMRLSDGEITLDSELLELLEVKKNNYVDEAALEYSWVSAKKEAQLEKLRTAFVDNLQFDRFKLHSFDGLLSVTSLRTPHFTQRQQENIQAIQDLLEAEADVEEEEEETGSMSASFGSPNSNARSPKFKSPQKPSTADFTNTTATEQSEINQSRKDGTKSAIKSQLEKAEERKMERIARRKGLQELLARKPRQQDEDPKYLSEIVRAEQFMGDYVLKSDPNHVIPEHMRPTSERKSKQLVLLEHSINQLRIDFNQRLLGMRDLKERLCTSVNADKHRIREISQQLKIEYDYQPSVMKHEELPEKRFAIDQEGLERFEREQEKARKRQEALERAKKGFGADLATMDENEEEEEAAQNMAARRASHRQSMRRGSMHQPISAKDKVDLDMKYRLENIKNSDMEDEEAAYNRELLLHEKHRLERRVQKTVQGFDESLNELFHERLKLDADLAMADMRVLLLFREFQLLQDFKLRDRDLAIKLEEREKELRDVASHADACVQKVNAKERQMNEVKERLERTASGVDHWLHEHFPTKEHQDFLKKIFNRKIKRRKHNEDEDDDDNEATSEDESEEEEEDGFEDIEEVCPAYCTEELWNELLQMREGKLDLDDMSADGLKAVEMFNKETKDLQRKQDQATKALEKCKHEIDDFQRKKQKELNKLETIVVLKLSQIQCLTEEKKMPRHVVDAEVTEEQAAAGNDGSSGIVVFTQSGLDALRNRIYDLADQKELKNKESEALTSDKLKLLRRKARRQADHNEWEAKVYEVQLLKFGQRVDLEMLENVAVDRETEELKERLKMEEIRWERELLKQNEKLLTVRQQHQQRISENTVLLKDLGSLRAEQHDLEQTLQQSTQKIVAKMSGGSKVATAADRSHLKDLVVAQQQEIDALKNEIAMLRRKGGHVYTPVVAGMGNTQ